MSVVCTLRMMVSGTETDRMLRERLAEAVTRSGLGKGAFAELAGIDRTTLSQLLSPGNRLSLIHI